VIRRAAKGRKLVQILAALAVLAAVALPAGASIPRPGQLLEPNHEALLAAAREAPAPSAVSASFDAGFELFVEPVGDRFHLDLHAAADAPALARFHLLTPRKTRVRGFRLPEPLVIGVELPPSRTAFRLYGDVPYGFASGGLYVTTDPLGYVDGPNLYQYGLNNPANFGDPMGLERRVIEPQTEAARKIQGRYEEAYEAAKKTPSGGRKLTFLEESPDILLEVVYDPNREGMVVEPLEFDEAGRTVKARLRVGAAFPEVPSPRHYYPEGAKLVRKDELGVYTVGHEEIGHFLTSTRDPSYNQIKREWAQARAEAVVRRNELQEKLRAEILNSNMSDRKKRKKLSRLEGLTGEIAEHDPILKDLRGTEKSAKTYIENLADDAGIAIVREYRELPRSER